MPKMPAFGVPTFILSSIGGVAIDAAVSVSPSFPARVSDNPIESGEIVSDNVILLPMRIEMDGILTDTPALAGIGGEAAALFGVGVAATSFLPVSPVVTQVQSGIAAAFNAAMKLADGTFLPGRAKEQFGKLRELRDQRIPFRVVIDLGMFDNMVFESLSQTASAKDGRSIRFSASLKQLLIVGDAINANITAPLDNNGIAPDNVGTQTLQATT